MIGALHARLVEAGLGDAGFEVVAHEEFGHPSEEGEGAQVGSDEVGHVLGEGGLGIGVVAGAQGRHEDLYPGDLTGDRIGKCEGKAGVVYEELLAGFVGLAHSGVESGVVGAEASAELTVAQSGGVLVRHTLPTAAAA